MKKCLCQQSSWNVSHDLYIFSWGITVSSFIIVENVWQILGRIGLGGKPLRRSLFFYRPRACNYIKRETTTQVFSCGFCKILGTIFSIEQLWQQLLNQSVLDKILNQVIVINFPCSFVKHVYLFICLLSCLVIHVNHLVLYVNHIYTLWQNQKTRAFSKSS